MRGPQIPKCFTKRMVSVSAVILLLVGAANAYTVIMLGGRRVEIPSTFVVTPATLTYEVTDGIQITLPMAAIDIAATEKANHERPGSLMARAQTGTSRSSDQGEGIQRQQPGVASRRTITNRDLETLKRRRQDGETAYESKRKQLGLPSLEQSRKQAAAEFDLATTELAQRRNDEKQTEDYWRTRAATLRSEMAVLDAELNYLRSRLDEGPFSTPGWGGSFSSVGSILAFGNFRGSGHYGGNSFGNFGHGRSSRGQVAHRANVYVAPSYGPQPRARVGFGGGATRGQVLVNSGGFRRSRQSGGGGVIGVASAVTVSGFPVQSYDFTYELGALITRFNELAAVRAGVNARWRELEEEARRAGVSPGWLRQ
jgi:hypothetical protein